MADAVPEPGTILADKYRVDRVLGEGGMGVVLAATHLQLRQPVAIKLMHPEALEHGQAIARFLREARAAAGLQSEHVVRVMDVATLESGAPYLVMEHLSGDDLASVLRQRGPLPIAEAVGYLLQACEAIAEAHTMGIVHRDLKPANLFLAKRKDGTVTVKVLDFGISKEMKGEDGSLTATTQAMGSPFYMSPEQVRSTKNVDHRTDIWALGAILMELLTARLPFQGDTVGSIFAAIAADPPPLLRSLRPDAPPELEALISRCLTKNPDGRPPTVEALARELLPFAPASRASVERIIAITTAGSTTQLAAAETLVGPAVAPVAPPPTAGAWGGTQAASVKRRSGMLAISIAAGVVVAAVATVLFLVPSRRAPTLVAAEPSAKVLAVAAPLPSAVPIPAVSSPAVPVVSASVAPAATSAAPAAKKKPAKKGASPTNHVQEALDDRK